MLNDSITMRKWFHRTRSRLLVFLHDMLMIPVAWLGAYWIRFNLGYVPPEVIADAVNILPFVGIIMGSVYWRLGLYRGVWRFASVIDLIRITKAVLTGTTLLLFLLFIFNRMAFIPRSLPVLFIILQLLLLAGPRLVYRWVKEKRIDMSSGQRVLIVGAGHAGEMLVRDMLRNSECGYVPIAFVDDKPHRRGGDVHGIPIRGTSEQIPLLVDDLGIDLLLLAVPSASASEMQRLVTQCEVAGRPFRTVPQLNELMSGHIAVNQLRPVSLEDLLGRNPVILDSKEVHDGLADRVILVTGAGGSIGSELCRQLRKFNPSRLILVDHCEYNLYRIETELLDSGIPLAFGRHLLDVADSNSVNKLFQETKPEIVFHTAAYKHVPLLENQIRAAVRNNIIGTEVMATAAAQWDCERFVFISTDKAVNPSNVMGASKRASELICQDLSVRSSCRFMTVRFGNVLGSTGSVVPHFQRQIEKGGPITITHPEIERFFMTIPEASQLIMQAAIIGVGGETFVLDMGNPIKISYLAEQMIRLSGQRPGQDIAIKYTKLRPGEKLHEDLFYQSEDLSNTQHPKIRVARNSEQLIATDLQTKLNILRNALKDNNESEMQTALQSIVPSWQPFQEKRESS